MPEPTPTPSTGHPADAPQDFAAVVPGTFGDTTIHAQIDRTRLDVTIGYRPEREGYNLDARHVGAWIELLQRVQTALTEGGAR